MEKLAEQLHARRTILRLLGIGVLLIDDLSILGPILPSTGQIRYMQSRRWIKTKPNECIPNECILAATQLQRIQHLSHENVPGLR